MLRRHQRNQKDVAVLVEIAADIVVIVYKMDYLSEA